MSPIQMAIALHYINETTDYNDGDFSDTLVGNTIQTYKDQGLLEEQAVLNAITSVSTLGILAPIQAPVQATLVATDGMRLYVDALSRIPLPKQIWSLG